MHTYTILVTHTHTQLGDVMGEGEFGPVVLGVASNIVPSEERTLVAVKVRKEKCIFHLCCKDYFT